MQITDGVVTENIKLEVLINAILKQENLSCEILKNKSRTRKISNARKVIVFLSDKYCNTTTKELSNKLGISMQMVSKIKAGDFTRNDKFESLIAAVSCKSEA
ncbi:MAG: hypothetical protein LR001_07715 [Clostridiales bacterium]|nr:hypothetical protein [Clostridiales bacterium]